LFELSERWRRDVWSIPLADNSVTEWFVQSNGPLAWLHQYHVPPISDRGSDTRVSSDDKSQSVLDSIEEDDPVGDACDEVKISDCVDDNDIESCLEAPGLATPPAGRKLGKCWCTAADLYDLKLHGSWLNGRVITLFGELCTRRRSKPEPFSHVPADITLDMSDLKDVRSTGDIETSHRLIERIVSKLPTVCHTVVPHLNV
jgi:hypothetical protein